ncbi:uncharacterized protein LOC130669666 [Microplitis mediator]|uniref:uncharacterized protein LOC130669666 n=1 Tax=Microplitis mediator TaxID=375433 RepID=UPI0025523D28|nr:uncharacterized protein LOC130669666 [Microplitis mediator]
MQTVLLRGTPTAKTLNSDRSSRAFTLFLLRSKVTGEMILVVDMPGTECITAINVPGVSPQAQQANIGTRRAYMVELSMITKCLSGNSGALAECKLLKNIFSNMYVRDKSLVGSLLKVFVVLRTKAPLTDNNVREVVSFLSQVASSRTGRLEWRSLSTTPRGATRSRSASPRPGTSREVELLSDHVSCKRDIQTQLEQTINSLNKKVTKLCVIIRRIQQTPDNAAVLRVAIPLPAIPIVALPHLATPPRAQPQSPPPQQPLTPPPQQPLTPPALLQNPAPQQQVPPQQLLPQILAQAGHRQFGSSVVHEWLRDLQMIGCRSPMLWISHTRWAKVSSPARFADIKWANMVQEIPRSNNFTCLECGEVFRSWEILVHVWKVHFDGWFACEFCRRFYSFPEGSEKHMRKRHPTMWRRRGKKSY